MHEGRLVAIWRLCGEGQATGNWQEETSAPGTVGLPAARVTARRQGRPRSQWEVGVTGKEDGEGPASCQESRADRTSGRALGNSPQAGGMEGQPSSGAGRVSHRPW